ncbi:hypothetical protein IW256_004741 [Actinomadura viridis]|uniref:Uncharacterized protein n=1 Tax=Actinomadura viridis TaxID=58110 RepID=A0A931DL86_9ACTN|nr:hypothetical protein [Actinomadura viridis]
MDLAERSVQTWLGDVRRYRGTSPGICTVSA